MKLLKRCRCTMTRRCSHPYWFRFFLHGREYRGSTRTGNRTLATRIAEKRKVEVLEGRTGLRRRRVPRLSKFIPDYTEWTAKTNRTAYKDAGVLAGFLASVGVEIPNPTKYGFCTCALSDLKKSTDSSCTPRRAPVTPVTETQ